MKKGIDISYWQGNINFDAVKKDGVEFVIIRSSYRNTEDAKLSRNINGFNRVNIPIHGLYHFSYALNENDAVKEAQFIVNLAKKYGLPKNTVLFYDFEYDTVTKAKNNGVTLTPKDCQRFSEVFCKEVEKSGYRAGVYFNIDYFRNWYQRKLPQNCVKWLADYTGGADYPCDYQQHTSKGTVKGINGYVDMNYFYGRTSNMSVTAKKVIETARSFLGYSEANGKFKEILNIYNNHTPLARGYKIKPTDHWCDCFVSAVAIKSGATDIIGTEVGCQRHIDIFKAKGIWIEDGTVTPKMGDIILFNWDDGVQPNDGYADHIGFVEKVENGYITCIEGNKAEKVDRRVIPFKWGYIRGFARPQYAKMQELKSIEEVAREVLADKWGVGQARKNALENAGYNYDEVQAKVTEIYYSEKAKKPQPEKAPEPKPVETETEWQKQKREAKEYVIEHNISDGTRGSDPLTREEFWVILKRLGLK